MSWLERSLISIWPPYPMRRRTIPRADTRNRHVYYDWDQRPCPSPPLPNSLGHHQKRHSHESSKTSSGAPQQPWVDINLFAIESIAREASIGQG